MNSHIRGAIIAATILIFPVAACADEFSSMIQEADAVRAQELSPSAYAAAKKASEQRWKDEAVIQTKKAIANSLTMSKNFSKLIESRDRMHVSGAVEVRRDLAERAEASFSQVVAAVEAGDLKRAKKEAEMAELLTYQAEVVAAREDLTRPISKAIADARKPDGNKFAPKSFDGAKNGLSKVEKLISSNPAARGQLVNDSRQSVLLAKKSQEIGELGTGIRKNPASLEKWIAGRDGDIHNIAALLGLKLDKNQSHKEQIAAVRMAIEQLNNQLADAQKQIDALQGDTSELAETRHKLKLKREAEAKIAQLATLFDASQVELFLTTDADVIIRMKAMNFPSGSSVIPSASYDLLELASRAIELFADRSVSVEGHTDFIGNDAYNQTLSESRANTVKEYLDARFAESKRTISSVGYGEDRPIANNEKAEGRQKNRRIDIVLVAPPMKN